MVREGARRRHEEVGFAARMRALFAAEPAGRLVIPTLEGARARIVALECRGAEVEGRLRDA